MFADGSCRYLCLHGHVYVCIHIYIYMYVCTHVYVCVYVRICKNVSMPRMCVCTCTETGNERQDCMAWYAIPETDTASTSTSSCACILANKLPADTFNQPADLSSAHDPSLERSRKTVGTLTVTIGALGINTPWAGNPLLWL